jgi:hypothetical protein
LVPTGFPAIFWHTIRFLLNLHPQFFSPPPPPPPLITILQCFRKATVHFRLWVAISRWRIVGPCHHFHNLLKVHSEFPNADLQKMFADKIKRVLATSNTFYKCTVTFRTRCSCTYFLHHNPFVHCSHISYAECELRLPIICLVLEKFSPPKFIG